MPSATGDVGAIREVATAAEVLAARQVSET